MARKRARMACDASHFQKFRFDNVGTKWSMDQLVASGQRFAHFPAALYSVDVTFQPTYAPAGSFREKKLFYSKKHGQYGLKVEASVLPTGFAFHVSTAVPGSVLDIAIFEANEEFHAQKMRKTDKERDMRDDGPLVDVYPLEWAILADKGYQGLQRRLRAITPTKRPPGGLLSMSEMENNDKIATDRVIVENFFGRMKTFWSIVSETYMWKRESYDLYFQTCVALTNVHIKFSPLRVEDGHERNRYLNGLVSSSEKKKAKRAVSVKKHREKRKLRLGTLLPSGENVHFDSETEFSGDESGFFEYYSSPKW
ncbi:hypothetical protein DYB32_001845, partial [Aphanomyces invadans]